MYLIIWLCVSVIVCNAGPLRNTTRPKGYQHYLKLPSLDRFREYLRIDTSKEKGLSRRWRDELDVFLENWKEIAQNRDRWKEWREAFAQQWDNTDYAVEFWIRQSNVLGLPYAVFAPAGKSIFVATLEGSDPSLPSIMLNTHMDDVKVDEREWLHPPFDAFMDENGDIEVGCGTQDSKDVGIQYLEAIKILKKDNITLARTLHLTVMPVMQVLIRGVGGHGSKMPEGSAMDNVNSWMREAGNSATVSYIRRETKSGITSVDETNMYWDTMWDTMTKLGLKLRPLSRYTRAINDMLVLRNIGIPAIGFCTKIYTTPRLHAKGEYQNVETFLKGINIYTEIIKKLCNTSPEAVIKEHLKNKVKC